jgi:GT2 family glycosyltransferase
MHRLSAAGATGDLIVRLDCHSRFPTDYLRLCVEAAEETGAWNVGGTVVPVGETPMEKAVAAAMDSPFGGIGWTRHASQDGRVDVDTVTFGAFRPEAFETIGLFDETLVRDQDDELNLRIRLAGGRIVLDPAITTRYTPRGSWRAVYRQYYEYGLWKVPVMRKHGEVLGGRSMVPIVFVGSLAALALLTVPLGPRRADPLRRLARRALATELSVYGVAAVAFGSRSLRQRGEPRELLPLVVSTYPAFHVGYGVGMAHGVLRALLAPRVGTRA